MKVLYDARKIAKDQVGVGNVVEKILRELLNYQDLQIVAFTRKGTTLLPSVGTSPNLTVHETSDDTQFFGPKRLWIEQTYIPKIIDRYQPDILHLTNGFSVPLFLNKKNKRLKIVSTIHDVIPFTPYKELMNEMNQFLFTKLFRYSIQMADKVVAVSQFTANDIKTYFPKVKDVAVIYNGIDPFPQITDEAKMWNVIKEKYQINDEFILYIGGFAPRKNVLNLIKAYTLFIEKTNSPLNLVLAGKFSRNKDIQDNIQNVLKFIQGHQLSQRVKIVKYLEIPEKVLLLKKARIFVYLSLYEGFGLPVLEALSAGTPTLTTKNSVMEEVAQKYSLYAEVQNSNDILDKMILMLSKYDFYKNLAFRASKELLPSYDWKAAGKKYYEIYKNIL